MSSDLPEHIQAIVDAIASERLRHEREAGPVTRAVNRATRATARPRFLAGMAAITAVWLVWNLVGPAFGYHAFDPPPFSGLANAACVLALGVSILIIITQRHETELAERRAELTLQLAIVNEQKSAKTLQMLADLRRDMPSVLDVNDPELDALAESVDPIGVLDAIRDSAAEGDGVSDKTPA